MSAIRDKAKGVGEAISLIDFSTSERNMVALVKLPALLFAEYVPDGERVYERGEVIRVGSNKFLIQNFGKIDPNNPPRIESNQVEPSLCKLFRDGGRYDWVREEFCLQGFERYYDDGDANRTGWYRVISARVDSGTPPPNDYQHWEKIEDYGV